MKSASSDGTTIRQDKEIKMKKPINERSCYNCAHQQLCFLFHLFLLLEYPGLGIIDVNSPDALKHREALYRALADMCLKFKEKKK